MNLERFVIEAIFALWWRDAGEPADGEVRITGEPYLWEGTL